MNLLDVAYIINLIILILASIEDIKYKIIPHKYVILMFLINLSIGYFYFGVDAIIALFSTFILCLILSIGMGGGDVKVFTALSPIFAYDFIYYIPKPILIIISLSMILVAIFPLYKIFIKNYKDILLSSGYLATVMGVLTYLVNSYNIKFGSLIIWGYIILSIFISRKYKKYKEIMKKLGFIFPIYLIIIFLLNHEYAKLSIIYFLELIMISVVIYALTGEEISEKKKIDELEEGDILKDVIIYNDDKVEIKNLNIFGRIKFLIDNELKKINKEDINYILCDGEGLSKENIKKIKDLYKKGKIPETLNVIKVYPFLPFVTVSYALYLLYVKL
ncbi:A24 family peptidase C-terminal domain-containing protein [Methanocaldococcus indicus]|uniref:A24 family peptidase C-terminal domain-containing protein n=1 Tax=Methanocaldococcus indicus TaxID=213231 RepID=UPI003C6CF788